MRGLSWLAVGLVLCLGCRSEVSEPELRRPLEAMPEGACILMLASDLANTWERAEAHDAVGMLQRSLPVDVSAPPELVQLQVRLAEFEAQTEIDVRQDLVLNMLKRRLAVGVYPEGAPERPDLLLVAELEDAQRFRSSLDALLLASEEQWEVQETVIDGKPAHRLRDGKRLDLVFLQDGEFLVVSTAEGLAAGALAIRDGRSATSALRDSLCIQALEELGPHGVAVVELQGTGRTPWGAQGFTWDQNGVHFKRLVPSVGAPLEQDETTWLRDEILGSIPTGMTLAYYARPAEASRLRDLFRHRSCLQMQHSAAPGAAPRRSTVSSLQIVPAAAPLGLDRLPFELVKDISRWAGDEMALVIDALLPTALAPLPSSALIIETTDPEIAAQSLAGLEAGLPMLPFMEGQDFTDVSYGGKTFRCLRQPVLDVLAPSYLVDENVVIITSTRELMQRIIDTRRVGRRSLTRQASFRPFASFVPDGASAVVYADQTKLHRMLVQLAELPRLWGEDVVRGVETLEGLSILFEHFPSSATYIQQTPQTLVLSGWMLEQE